MTRVPLAEKPPPDLRGDGSENLPVSGGRWYRLNVDGEPPLMGALVWLRVSDDLTVSGATLSVQLRLPLWTPEGLQYLQLNTTASELSAKKAERMLQRGMERQGD